MDRKPLAEDVNASEAGSYAFCAKAWHLEHISGALPSKIATELRACGTAAHIAQGTQTRRFHRITQLTSCGMIVLCAISVALLALRIFMALR